MSNEVHGLSPKAVAGWIAESGHFRAENERLRLRLGEAEISVLAMVEHSTESLRTEIARLRDGLQRADGAIQKAAMSLGSTDEWTDQEAMIADFEARLNAEIARLQGDYETLACDCEQIRQASDDRYSKSLKENERLRVALLAFMNIRTSKGDRPGSWSHILLECAWGKGQLALAPATEE